MVTPSLDILAVILGLMVLTLGLFTWPFWGRVSESNQADTTDLYRKQISELEVDLADGLITKQDFDIARGEVARRLLRASKKETPLGTGKISPLIVGGMIVVLLTGSFYAYFSLGRPDLGDKPTLSSLKAAKDQIVKGVDGTDQSVGDLINQLEAVLAAKPDDIQGWTIMARTADQMGDAPRMAMAYGNLARLQPDKADWLAMQGEALVRISAGRVTPAASFVFLKANTLEPKHPLPRYYLGVAANQDGDVDRALVIWQALKADSADDAPWMNMLNRQINAALAERDGTSGPTNEQRDAVQSMSPAEQKEFINQMVAGLRAKLRDNPDDLEGWLRLARAEQVLGNIEGEREALERALTLATGQQRKNIAERLEGVKK
jgi:cytochrome c-type biogenesis protein CcmH